MLFIKGVKLKLLAGFMPGKKVFRIHQAQHTPGDGSQSCETTIERETRLPLVLGLE